MLLESKSSSRRSGSRLWIQFIGRGLGYSGSTDLHGPFAPDAPWPNAAAHVKVFKIYVTLLTSYSDLELKRMFADLKSRQIALALEFAALTCREVVAAPALRDLF